MPTKEIAYIKTAVDYIQSKCNEKPTVGIVLGTGLSGLSAAIQEPFSIKYCDIPHFPVSTVQSHQGELIIGKLGGVTVVAMAGRFHYYEGYSMKEVTFPIKVLKLLGIKHIILSNASGSAHPNFNTGDIVVIKDHINFQPENPLRGVNLDELGPRFPDMVNAYDEQLIHLAQLASDKLNYPIKEAVYVGVQGPNLETKAEFKFFRAIGGDIVGMSTVPEVIVANHMNLPVLAFSVVTNEGWTEDRQEANVDEIIAVAQKAAKKLEKIVIQVLQSLNK
ncbi:MAG: purine-nucleoside phosphorylase [Chitinophagales bacterium]